MAIHRGNAHSYIRIPQVSTLIFWALCSGVAPSLSVALAAYPKHRKHESRLFFRAHDCFFARLFLQSAARIFTNGKFATSVRFQKKPPFCAPQPFSFVSPIGPDK
jgi:hypothetical protein